MLVRIFVWMVEQVARLTERQHTSRTVDRKINGLYLVDDVVEFCSSPTCSCDRVKTKPLPLAIVRE